jgi:hypothetical protein
MDYEATADKYTGATGDERLLIRMTRSMFIAELQTAERNAAVALAQREPAAWIYEERGLDGVWEDRISRGPTKPCWEVRNLQPLFADHAEGWQGKAFVVTPEAQAEIQKLDPNLPASERLKKAVEIARRSPAECTTCGGSGEIDERLGGIATSGVVPCPDCRTQPETGELPADGSPPAWCCKGAAPAAACRCAIEEGELVRLRAQVERLTAAVSGLFAGGFIEAGVRESDQWSQELDVRIGHLKSALPSTEKK